jgi:hypothetical protein
MTVGPEALPQRLKPVLIWCGGLGMPEGMP